jgi:hypothetical protein
VNAELLALYRKCRLSKPFMLVGFDAKCSLDAARTILEFRELEARGLVRMRAEPEQESYFSVFGEPEPQRGQTQKQANEALEAILERDGVWWTCSEWFDGDEWQHADSCGMHAGYKNPLDPFENCYVVDEMQAAIDAWKAHLEEMAGAV